MSNIKYRKDIDGLRAFAVLSVVLFHLNISWIKSGFLGVDIFFVISGYLITSIILRDLQNNCFSIKNFYLRRIRRIIPALIVVLVFSTFFAWLILLPQDLIDYAESLVSAIASFSNIYFFVKLDFGYFGQNSQIIPLLHTWSLGVEEQFYMIWPLILILLFKLRFSTKVKLLATSIILLIISCLIFLSGEFNLYILSSDRWYYFPTHRAFELLFGCCLAIYLNNSATLNNNKLTLNILSVIGALMMIVPIFFINVSFPSIWTVIACIGATIYIYSGANTNFTPIINRILSLKPFVAIGLISYSLYLWHWPIIAYVNYLSINKTVTICVIIFTISLALATLTYLFVEKSFRHKYKFSFNKSFILLWIIPLILACCFFIASTNNKFGFNSSNLIDQNKLTYNYGFNKIDQSNCFLMIQSASFQSKQLPNINVCSIGSPKAKDTNFLLVGDSHARSEIPMITTWLDNINQKAYVVTQKSTPFLPTFKNVVEYVSVTDRNKAIANLIKSKKYKYVILAGEWSNALYSSSVNSIQESIKLVMDNGSIPVLILDTPTLNIDVTNLCPLEKNKLPFIFGENSCKLNIEFVKQQQLVFSNLVEKLKKEFPKLVIIDPKKAICDDSYCNIEINSIPIYADSNHLNYIGSELLGKKYLSMYGNPLKFTTKH
ncbi:acyltransferase family protein [Francisella philomiragia]|uniref:acyltransferase family protein n=2 Tax=Francisella TaxID=262 RepID=UPI001B8CBE36|nr:acyltransferase family protein [Francisella philomiragia]QUE30905.1 acyltransferase [Francisella philomiragia]